MFFSSFFSIVYILWVIHIYIYRFSVQNLDFKLQPIKEGVNSSTHTNITKCVIFSIITRLICINSLKISSDSNKISNFVYLLNPCLL